MKKIKFFIATTAICFMLLYGCRKIEGQPAIPDLSEVIPGECTTPPLRTWLFQQFVSWGKEPTIIAASEELQMSNMANFYAIHFENSPENQYFGVNGEYTNKVNQTFGELKRFWNNPFINIINAAAHGSIMQDRSKVLKTYKQVFGYSDSKANQYADSIAILLKTYPQFLKGDHPAFTFNQFAIPDTTVANVGPVRAKIIIGDGLLQGFEALGYGDNAPQAILAHEFGHQIQYDLGILKPGMKLVPKTSRRIELMADAYASYFLSHARGAAMKLKDVQQVAEVFFNTGDCDFTVASHHGTPNQRRAATEWGYSLARNSQKLSPIIPAKAFAKLFDEALPEIIKN